jgi:hypothetical protein
MTADRLAGQRNLLNSVADGDHSLAVGCVRKAAGAVDYFMSVVEDISQRKQSEARLAERAEDWKYLPIG